jgi:hypothetical protein
MKYLLILLFAFALFESCSATKDCPNYSKVDKQTENINS